jgi:hypothetical protein
MIVQTPLGLLFCPFCAWPYTFCSAKIKVNDMCRGCNTAFLSAETFGFRAMMFADFGSHRFKM